MRILITIILLLASVDTFAQKDAGITIPGNSAPRWSLNKLYLRDTSFISIVPALSDSTTKIVNTDWIKRLQQSYATYFNGFSGTGSISNPLTLITTPSVTSGSNVPITSDAVYNALQAQANLTNADGSLTLSGAYNGSAARTIGLNLNNPNVFSAVQTVSIGGLNTSFTDGYFLKTPTLATSTQNQYGPSFHFQANGWNTSALASQPVDWKIVPTAGSGNLPAGNLNFVFQSNNNGYLTKFQFKSTGSFESTGGAIVSGIGSIGTTSTDGFQTYNATSSTVGVPVQYSPRFQWLGTAWNTTSSASNLQQFIAELRPVSGATPSANLVFGYQNNGSGGFVTKLTLGSDGSLITAGGLSSTTGNFSSTLTGATANFSGTITAPNYTGLASNSFRLNGYTFDSAIYSTNMEAFAAKYTGQSELRLINAAGMQTFLGLGSNAYTSTAYAPLASPTFTGTVTVPSATNTSSTAAVNQSWVNSFAAILAGTNVYSGSNTFNSSVSFNGTTTVPSPSSFLTNEAASAAWVNTNFSLKSDAPIAGSFSGVGTATTTFTVTIGTTQANTTYKVNATPTSQLALGGYVTNKTTTTFDYVLPVTTGSVTFDWSLFR